MNEQHCWSVPACACCERDTLALAGGRLDRRGFLVGAAATMVAAGLRPGGAAAGLEAAKPYRIDVHHHLSPPSYVAAANASHLGEPTMNGWTAEKSLEDMDRAGVAVAILSITAPALSFVSGAQARRLARECNDYAAKLVADYPGRFGAFAAIPLVDIDGSLDEIVYALDTLKLDGIALMTSYGDKWLGDPLFEPVMKELHRRKSVVYTHPTSANCCVNLMKNVRPAVIEFGTDTTRTIADIVFSGNAKKFHDIRWIFSHAGGTMPFLIERFVRNALIVPGAAAAVPDGALAELKRFHYDTAQTSNKAAMAALSAIVPLSQILLGSDFPYRTSLDHVNGLREAGLFTAAQLFDIERGNALRLLPRLSS